MLRIKKEAITVYPTDIKSMRISLTNLCQYSWRSRIKNYKKQTYKSLTVKEKILNI